MPRRAAKIGGIMREEKGEGPLFTAPEQDHGKELVDSVGEHEPIGRDVEDIGQAEVEAYFAIARR